MFQAPKYVHEYVFRLAEAGWEAFCSESRYPVLVGLGVAGEMQDRDQGFSDSTMNMSSFDTADLFSEGILVDRVWVIKKKARARGIRDAAISVGRTAVNDVTIPEYSLSRKHCGFKYRRDGTIWIVDFGSKNGSRLRGVKLFKNEEVQLHSGDRLVLGRYGFQFFTGAGFADHVRSRMDA